jgi:hypothetical protein
MQSKTIYHKEGAMDMATGAVVPLIVGIGVSVMVIILVGALGGKTYNVVEPSINEIYGNQAMESFTASNASYTNLDFTQIVNSTFKVSNGSSSVAIAHTNYTLDPTTGSFILSPKSQYVDTLGGELYANYTYGDIDIKNSIDDAIGGGFQALSDLGDLLPLIVLAFVMGLVLFMVVGLGGVTNRGGSAL